MVANVDFVGNDVGRVRGVDSSLECQRRCLDHSGACDHWTWISPDADLTPSSRLRRNCFLKSAGDASLVRRVVHNRGFFSGIAIPGGEDLQPWWDLLERAAIVSAPPPTTTTTTTATTTTTTIPTTAMSMTSTPCEEGWFSGIPAMGRCYKVVREALSQEEAAEKCRDVGGGFLAEPRTRAQLESLNAVLQANNGTVGGEESPGFTWMGLEDRDGDGAWTWLTDGAGITDSEAKDLFFPGQPNGRNGSEPCIVAEKEDGYLLHDYPCSRKHWSVCQYDIGGQNQDR